MTFSSANGNVGWTSLGSSSAPYKAPTCNRIHQQFGFANLSWVPLVWGCGLGYLAGGILIHILSCPSVFSLIPQRSLSSLNRASVVFIT